MDRIYIPEIRAFILSILNILVKTPFFVFIQMCLRGERFGFDSGV